MRSIKSISVLLIVFLFSFVGCGDGGGGGGDTEHSLSINIDPSNDAGSVTPSGGTYYAGDQVSITASANSGWIFESWSGAKNSSENPLEFSITDDMRITANFIQNTDEFETTMIVSNGSVSDSLDFGLLDQNGVQEGLDSQDYESPPIAPATAFFTGFIHDHMNLYRDYRPLSEEVIWELRLNRNANSYMDLSWSFSDGIENGELKLVSDPNVSNPTLEIDMLAQSSYTVSDPSIQSLFIVYTVTQAKRSVITGVDDSSTSGATTNGEDSNSNTIDIPKPNTNSSTQFDRSEDF